MQRFDYGRVFGSFLTIGRIGGDVVLTGGQSMVADAVIPEGCPADAVQVVVANN